MEIMGRDHNSAERVRARPQEDEKLADLQRGRFFISSESYIWFQRQNRLSVDG
jgi:hypothetical protein